MLTKALKNALRAVGASLVLGMVGQSALAMEIETMKIEEIVVYGIDGSLPQPSAEFVFRSEMKEYLRSLNEELKIELDRKFALMRMRSIQLAATGSSTRG